MELKTVRNSLRIWTVQDILGSCGMLLREQNTRSSAAKQEVFAKILLIYQEPDKIRLKTPNRLLPGADPGKCNGVIGLLINSSR